MRKGSIVLLAFVAVAAAGCSHGVSRIRTHTLPGPNPTSYSFPMPVEQVHAGALEAFSTKHQYKEPIFKKPAKTDYWQSTLSVECVTNANAHDIHLDSSHTPVAASVVYRGRNGALPLIADFHVRIESRGSDTLVSVNASETEVVNGTKFGIGSCGPGQHWNYVKVKPTTIEEYTVLSYLGRHLGFTNMPAMIVPAE